MRMKTTILKTAIKSAITILQVALDQCEKLDNSPYIPRYSHPPMDVWSPYGDADIIYGGDFDQQGPIFTTSTWYEIDDDGW